jgi:hypothetical protein
MLFHSGDRSAFAGPKGKAEPVFKEQAVSTKWVFLASVMMLACGAGAARGDLATGLGNYWPFEEGTGTIAHDVISGQNGTLTNFDFNAADGWRPGKIGNYALQFDGVNDYVNLGLYSIPQAASISAWVDINSFGGIGASPVAKPFYILGSETANYGTTTFVQPDGSVWIVDRNTAGQTDVLHTAPGIVTADSTWHQIVYVRGVNAIGTESIYVDGINRAQGVSEYTINNPAAPGAIGMGYDLTGAVPPGPAAVGGPTPPTPAPVYANGLIDDVRVYGRLLSVGPTAVDQPAGGEVATLDTTDPILGDTNLDGTVNINDLCTLINNFGKAGGLTSGDFDYSNTVNINDLCTLINNFGKSGSVSSGVAVGMSLRTVPEPSTLALLAAGLIGLLAGAWRRQAA